MAGDMWPRQTCDRYLDAAAAVDFMIGTKGYAPADLISHGFSLGGSMAAAAALHNSLGALVLDHTFTSVVNVAQHMVEGAAAAWLPDFIVKGVVEGAARSGFKPGVAVDLGRAGTVKTDGLSSVGKLRAYKGTTVVVYGTNDHIMPVPFADDFEAAAAVTRVEIKDGGHWCDQFSSATHCRMLTGALGLSALM